VKRLLGPLTDTHGAESKTPAFDSLKSRLRLLLRKHRKSEARSKQDDEPSGTSAGRCVILPAMDVERTIEFILKTQAQTDLRMAGITKLVQQGMRILAKHDESIEKLTKTQERMTNAQERLTKAQERLTSSQERLTSSQERLTSSQERLTTAQKGTQTSIEALSHIVADLGRAQKRTELKMAELSDAQKATERTLKTFISSLGRRNSRNNHKI